SDLPTRMADITRSVQQALTTLDPEHDSEFEENAGHLVEQLEVLDEEFEQGLSSCARRDIVTSHAAFEYLADRYGLQQYAVSGLDPESETSPRRLQQLAEIVEERGVTTVFFETLVPKELAETLARETGTATAALDPLESPPAEGDYLSAMRANLGELRLALDCD
ncbi:MAG: zinc ABC transporter substrate-binding protein, partial [Actinobacteria bacterium]|nr:zinc ABC transporter substrate-binding protein [Actinomycetota bacterium]